MDFSTGRRDQLRHSDVERAVQDSVLPSVVKVDDTVHKVTAAFDYDLNGTITFEHWKKARGASRTDLKVEQHRK